MALREEEELALDSLDFGLAGLDTLTSTDFLDVDDDLLQANLDRLTSDGMEGGADSDSIGASWDLFKVSMGGGIDYLDRAFGLPSWLTDYGDDIKSEGEEALQQYYQEYPGTLSEQEHILPWVLERVAEGATHNAVNLLGLGLASIMFRNPTAGRLAVGTMSAGATTALNFLAQLNEGVQVHASAAGKRDSEMSEAEIRNAIIPAIQNVVLDLYMPVHTTKLFKGKKLTGDAFQTALGRLTTEQLETLSKMLVRGAKATLYTAGSEGITEALQGVNLHRTSKVGLGGVTAEDVLSDFLVGTAAGGIMASPFNVGQATAANRQLRADQNLLDAENFRRLDTAKNQYKIGKEEYDIAVTDYKKTYQKLLDDYQGPLDKEGKPSIDLQPPTEPDDITPELFEFPRVDKTVVSNLVKQTGDALLNRSGASIEDVRAKLKTGKDMYHLDRISRSMLDRESGTGEGESAKSFNTLKHVKYGEHARKFFDIKDKWQESRGPLKFLTGEMFARVKEDIDKYIGLGLENKKDSQLRSKLRRRLGGAKFRELERDIVALRKLSTDVWRDLSKQLGKDGMTIGFVKGYLTRGIDAKSVEDPKAQERFIEALLDPNLVNLEDVKDEKGNVIQTARDLANEILNDILNGVNPSTITSQQIRQGMKGKGMGKSSFEKRRDAKWDKLPEEFRKKSPLDSMSEYIQHSATRLASAEAFGGDHANKLVESVDTLVERGVFGEKEAQKVWDLYDAFHHVYKRPKDEADRLRLKAYKVIQTGAAVKFLGLATISSWTEPAWIFQRAGIWNTFKAVPSLAKTTLVGISRAVYAGGEGKQARTSFGRELIRVMGFAINPKMNEKIDKLFAGDNNQLLQTYFRTPAGLFLTQYTNWVRTWTALAGLNMVQSQANKLNRLKGNKRALLVRELRENGMTIEDFKAIKRAGGGKIDILNDKFLNTEITKSDGTKTRVRDLLVPWLRKITTDVALEPHAGNRPLWMSNPEMQLLAQLKSFPVLFGNTIAKRVVRKMNPKQCTPDFMGKVGALAATATALAIAGLAMAIKDEIKGIDVERTPKHYVAAIGIPYVADRNILETIAGPSLNIASDISASFFDDGFMETLFKAPEEIFDLLLRATFGALGAEAMEND